MAFTQRQPGTSVDVYNIDRAVGYGAPCHKVDTMLVQALLHIFFYEQDGRFTPSYTESGHDFTAPAGHESVEVDGFIGPATRAHIRAFQQGLAEDGRLDFIDVRMDPMRESVYTMTTRTHAHYTIAWLNASLANRVYQTGDYSQYTGLPHREDLPIQLRNALKTRKTLPDQYRFRIR